MAREHEPATDARGLRFAVVAARFNQAIVERLVAGAVDALRRHGVGEDAIDLAWVPGSFEIPLVAKRLACGGRYAAVVCLGAVIRGDTAHFEYVAGPCASGIAQAALETGVPIAFGVLTTNDEEQALARAGGAAGNKGAEAAATAVEMVALLRSLPAARRC